MSGLTRRLSKFGKPITRTRSLQRCRGCGRRLPARSWVALWSVWHEGERERMRLCSDCQEVVYGCPDREPICHQRDEWIVRNLCECCDRFPVCEKVEYLRDTRPGDIFFGDLDMGDRDAG